METDHTLRHTVLAGIVSAVVGFTSSFVVVLAGLRAVGATAQQAASGLTVLSLTMGLGCLIFSLRLRVPITIAWSTPGAALLATSAAPAGGFATAVGAFVVTGMLLALSGLIRPLGDAVRRIPVPLANAMLAGVLLHLCVQPFADLVKRPGAIGAVLLVWLVLLRVARRWAVPGALAAAVVVMALSGTFSELGALQVIPQLTWTTPSFHPAAVIALALPLYVVTMTSQNIPGIAVLDSFGYRPPVAPLMAYTGGATALGAGFGGHAINLAAISAALAAGPEAHPDPRRRWVAGGSCGITYIGFGLTSGVVTQVSNHAPTGLLPAIAGVALIGTFAASASAALGDEKLREAAAVTFLVAASGMVIGGIGAAFWALIAGLGFHAALTWGHREQ